MCAASPTITEKSSSVSSITGRILQSGCEHIPAARVDSITSSRVLTPVPYQLSVRPAVASRRPSTRAMSMPQSASEAAEHANLQWNRE
jgi:hypothetical protein